MEDAVFKTYIRGIWCVQCPELIITGLLQTRGVIDADVAYFQSLVELGYPPFARKPSALERIAASLLHRGGGAA